MPQRKFRTQYDPVVLTPSPSGDKLKKEFQLEIEPDGNRRLVETGVKDVYAEIQSYKYSCTVQNVVKRALGGDMSALAKQQGVFCDQTLLPTDLITANEAVRQVETVYRKLPADVRAKYGGFNEFVKAFGTLEGVRDFYANLTNPPARSEKSDTAQSTNGGELDAE